MSHEALTLIRAWLPNAIEWAKAQERLSLGAGRALTPSELELATRVGVREASQIRLHVVEEFPRPEDEGLREVADHLGFFSPGMIGLTLGYAVLVAAEHRKSVRLLRHEFRHVYQYETAGTFEEFLEAYLQQVVEYGYPDAPLEVDARAYEVVDPQFGRAMS